MNIIRNDTLIKRNARIAQFTMIGGLLVLVGGMFISFSYQNLIWISFGSLLVGFLLTQVGIYFSNRWSRRPRPDELLDQALKGLDNKYWLYHYKSPISHLLLGPSGVWVLSPRHQGGTISYTNGRWHQKGGNLYLKIFAQESLGRPDVEITGEIERLQKALSAQIPEENIPPIFAALILTNPKATINVSDEETPPAETVYINKLKDLIRKSAKTNRLSTEKVKLIQETMISD